MYSIITDMIIGKTIDVSNRKNVGLSMKRNLNINRTLWQKPFLLSFLLTEERRLLRHSFLAIDLSLSLNFLNLRATNEAFHQPGNIGQISQIHKKVQAHISLELPLEYNYGQNLLGNQKHI